MDRVTIYTDGACSGNPGIGGWGAILQCGDVTKEIHGGARNTTNNRMELTAAIEALSLLKRSCEVRIYTDSQYIRNGITEWIGEWLKNNWKNSKKQEVLNRDLWQRLWELDRQHHTTWFWVKGHDGNELNERADWLARLGIGEIRNGMDGNG